jgi:hypothetical protein
LRAAATPIAITVQRANSDVGGTEGLSRAEPADNAVEN